MKSIRRSVEQKIYECRKLRKRTHALEASMNEVKTEIEKLTKADKSK